MARALPAAVVRSGQDTGPDVAARLRVAQSGESGETRTDERRMSETGTSSGLTEAEEALVKQLSARDMEVRRHEQAHAAVGGRYAGMPTYTYQSGPDGQRYAIGGEVPIDISAIPGDPEATIQKMRIVAAAALAPAEPSTADRRIAALARSMMLEAQAALNAERLEEMRAVLSGSESGTSGDGISEVTETDAGQGSQFGSNRQESGPEYPYQRALSGEKTTAVNATI